MKRFFIFIFLVLAALIYGIFSQKTYDLQSLVSETKWHCGSFEDESILAEGNITTAKTSIVCSRPLQKSFFEKVDKQLENILKSAFHIDLINDSRWIGRAQKMQVVIRSLKTLNPNHFLTNWGYRWEVSDHSEILIAKYKTAFNIDKLGLSIETSHPFLQSMQSIDWGVSFYVQGADLKAKMYLTTRINTEKNKSTLLVWKYARSTIEPLLLNASQSQLVRFSEALLKNLK